MTKEEKQIQKGKREEIEQMRDNVLELELRARYWKAQYDIRLYTLEAEKLQIPYDEWLSAQQKKNDELRQQYEEQIAKLQESPEVAVEEA